MTNVLLSILATHLNTRTTRVSGSVSVLPGRAKKEFFQGEFLLCVTNVEKMIREKLYDYIIMVALVGVLLLGMVTSFGEGRACLTSIRVA